MVPVIIPYSFSETGADLSFVWPGAYAILRKTPQNYEYKIKYKNKLKSLQLKVIIFCPSFRPEPVFRPGTYGLKGDRVPRKKDPATSQQIYAIIIPPTHSLKRPMNIYLNNCILGKEE